jgi:hypothetical protein
VPLARSLTDEDWERLVARLRETFDAEGRVRVVGARREWRVGNLRVTHEPAGDGAVLDLRTRKGDAMVLLRTGGAALAFAALLGAATFLLHGNPQALGGPALGAAVGLVLVVAGAVRLPAWSSARTRQFASLGDFARRLSAP